MFVFLPRLESFQQSSSLIGQILSPDQLRFSQADSLGIWPESKPFRFVIANSSSAASQMPKQDSRDYNLRLLHHRDPYGNCASSHHRHVSVSSITSTPRPACLPQRIVAHTIMTQPLADESPNLDVRRISRAWRSFMAYRSLSLQVFDSQAIAFENLPEQDQALIVGVPIRLSHAAEAIEHNADVIERIAALAGINTPFNPEELPPDDLEQTIADFPDVVDGLLGIVRDWSAVASKNRSLAYDPVIRAVEEAAEDAVSAQTVNNRRAFAVLIPGASLGRLPWELAKRGFAVQGVESSYLQLFMCNYIINGTATPESPLHLYPFAHHTGMVQSVNDQCKEVEFPDTNPRLLDNSNFSMVAGEFLELYDDEKVWDCVATCFCIENSHCIVSYIRRIAKILKTGGVWVNHGSLDFRYDDSMTEPSVEITAGELDLVIERAGMRIIKTESLRCRPPFAVTGMIDEEYKSAFTVAIRV